MKVHKAFCLFEQSGTWKNEFRKLGIDAEDYDILDDFGETDHVIDLFGEIEKAYSGAPSLFDEIGSDDLAVAFFPCTRFEAVIPLAFRGEQLQQKAWTDARKLEYSMQLHGELHDLYMLICKLFAIANRGGVAPHCGKSGVADPLSDAIFPGKAENRRPGQNGKRGLFQEANAILVCKLRAGTKYVFRAFGRAIRFESGAVRDRGREKQKSPKIAYAPAICAALYQAIYS